MSVTIEFLVGTAAINLIASLLLAWIASLIVYAKIKALQRIFVSTQYLIRAHIDFLLMTLLLVVTYYLSKEFSLAVPPLVIVLACIGAIYNPLGFVLLAIKPTMANPKTTAQKVRILVAFLPATIGFGYPMILLLLHLLQ